MSPAQTTQAQKGIVGVSTTLGKDAVIATDLSGREEISRLFSIRIGLASEKTDIKPQDLVGKPISIRLGREDAKPTYLHGIVKSLSAGGQHARSHRSYRAEVVPWLWFLTLRENCRIFQQKTAKQILEAIFGELGFSDVVQFDVKRTLTTRDYCVQYRESDFDFVSRLMEEEGIFYFFKHEEKRHVMVVADHSGAYAATAAEAVKFSETFVPAPHVSKWEHSYEFQSGAFALTDYNFETPSTSLLAKTKTVVNLPGTDKYEVYEYPGLYAKAADGNSLVKIRMEERESDWSSIEGRGTCGDFHPGTKFKLTDHPFDKAAAGKSFVIIAVAHGSADEDETGVSGSVMYANEFVCLPDNVPFRPERRTRRPAIPGCQTAVVVGPKGEEIYTDKYGRVKVQFHWDREGKKDEKASCWVRVSQFWAGKNWGAHFHPRIGQEVVVEFIDGDPDRPLVTGGIYNAEQMPPYALPANQTQSGVKSRSSKEGATENFNELRFEDKKGSEEVYFHAEKDMNRVVENNDTLKVGSDKADDGSQTIEIWKNRTETLKTGDEKVTIEKGKREVFVKEGAELLEVTKGKRTVTVGEGDDVHEVKKGKRTVTVSEGDDVHEVKKGKRTVTVATGDDTLSVKGKSEVSVDGDAKLTIKTGNHTVKVSAGKSSIEAAQAIELKVGANSVKIDASGITIKGVVVSIEGKATLEAKSPLSTVKGDGLLTLKGGVTMIN